jgi:hypothetical protein
MLGTGIAPLLFGLTVAGQASAQPAGPAPAPASAAAPAPEPEPQVPPVDQPPAESTVVTWQILGGSGVALAASVAVIGMASAGDGTGGFFVWPLALAVPMASGWTACSIGDNSVAYRTSCARATVGAYAGAVLGALAGAAIPHFLTWGHSSSDAPLWIGGAIGFVAGQGVLGTFGGRRRIVQEPRPRAATPARGAPIPMRGQVVISLISGTF